MENRIIEIARKKAHGRPDKNHRAEWNNKANTPAFFVRTDLQSPPRFPADIKPERRQHTVDAETPLIMPTTAPEKQRGAVAASVPGALLAPSSPMVGPKPVAKRKPAAKMARKPRVRANTAKKSAPKKQRVKQSIETATAAPAAAIPIPTHDLQTAPLPRAKAVAVYRKNGMLDVLGYWLRTRFSDIAKMVWARPKRAKNAPPIAQVLAENAALRTEIARLRSLQNG